MQNTTALTDGGSITIRATKNGNIRIELATNQQMVPFFAKRSKTSALTIRPQGTRSNRKDALTSKTSVRTVNDSTVTMRTYESGKITASMPGQWVVERITYPHTSGTRLTIALSPR